MSIEIVTGLMFGSLLALLLTGRQIFAIIGFIGTIAALAIWGTGGFVMPFSGLYSYTVWSPILTIGPFIFMGLILSRTGVADKLFQAIYLWAGNIKGGLGMGTIVLCALISTISGSVFAATTTAGTIALPAMLKRKYDKRIATGLTLAGGALGFLIPPSIVFIIFGMIAKTSIGHLWLAGIIPGILLAGMHMAYIGIRCKFQPDLGPALPPEIEVSWRDKLKALRAGIPVVLLIFMVLGLLFLGVTSLIECSAIGAIGAMVLAAIDRKLSWPLLKTALDDCLKITTTIMFIFLAALLFGAVFNGIGATHAIENLLGMIGVAGKWQTLILMQATFFGLGCFMDDTALLLIVAPLYIPLAVKMGFDLVWYGVLYVLNMQMSMLTPPFGYNLFLIKAVIPKDSGITMVDIYKSILPFVGVQAACLGIVMVFPQIALWLPNLVFGH